MFEYNEAGYLPPRADRAATVAVVVDAIAAGCDTAASIAAGIGMAERQGSYYPHAAAALGYVVQDTSTVPATWRLTESGARFASLPAQDRAGDLTDALARFADLDVATASSAGRAQMAEQWSGDGYSEVTVSRRLRTLDAWAQFLALDAGDQVAELDGAMGVARDFAPAAARALAEIRRAQVKARELTFGAPCDTCFTTMSLTGVCDTCS